MVAARAGPNGDGPHYLALIGKDPAARRLRIWRYEDFFNPTGPATLDNLEESVMRIRTRRSTTAVPLTRIAFGRMRAQPGGSLVRRRRC